MNLIREINYQLFQKFKLLGNTKFNHRTIISTISTKISMVNEAKLVLSFR